MFLSELLLSNLNSTTGSSLWILFSVFLLLQVHFTMCQNIIRQKTKSIITERQKLVKLLPASLISAYDAVIEYTVFLDTYIPKLAHYYGFVYGNKNNYNPDSGVFKKYREWLSTYLGIEPEGENNALL